MPRNLSRSKPRKKIAASRTLSATIHGTKVAGNPSLIDKARNQGARYSERRRTWFDDFEDLHPVAAVELRELAAEWHSHGPARTALPTMSALYRFVVDETGIHVGFQAFRSWLHSRRGAQ